MNKLSRETIHESLLLTRRLIDLADKALDECEEDSCLLLSSIIRDSAYSIKQAVSMYVHRLDEAGHEASPRESLLG
ncbi:MAG: hypothetical protein WCA08_26395 [Desulfoferrobacter sp.]